MIPLYLSIGSRDLIQVARGLGANPRVPTYNLRKLEPAGMIGKLNGKYVSGQLGAVAIAIAKARGKLRRSMR